MDIFEAEMARRFVVAVEKIANALDCKDEPQTEVNCERCKHKGEYNYCHYCEKGHGDNWYEPQTGRGE